jgi:hypothetical protein
MKLIAQSGSRFTVLLREGDHPMGSSATVTMTDDQVVIEVRVGAGVAASDKESASIVTKDHPDA